jgi:Protein of unknown function (DUF3995)
MGDIVAVAVIVVFAVLASIHVYWALGGRTGSLGALPELHGRPAFVPSSAATLAVAIGLVGCAVMVAASAGLIASRPPVSWVTWLAFTLALVLLARSVGDFRLVGFFKRVHGSRFARLDSAVYAPLCLCLALSVFYVAYVHRA